MAEVNPFEVYQADSVKKQSQRSSGTGKLVPDRMKTLRYYVDAGEQVVGSDHAFEIGPIDVVDDFHGGGTVFVAVSPLSVRDRSEAPPPTALAAAQAQAFQLETGPNFTPLQFGGGASRPLRVHFRPTVPGNFSAELHLRILWADGNISEETVRVGGRARSIYKVPAANDVDLGHNNEASQAGNDEIPSRSVSVDANPGDVQSAANAARDKVDLVADAQRDGIGLAQRESESFSEAVPDKGPWWILADIALSMGIGAIASVVAKGVAKSLVGKVITDPAVLKESKSLLALTDGLKDGMKAGAKKVIPELSKPDKPEKVNAVPSAGQFSSNPTIDFWERQRTGLRHSKATQRKAITDAENAALTMPKGAGLVSMQGIAEGYKEAGEGVEIVLAQAFASETQWMAGVAQSTFGHELVRDSKGREATTTDTTHLRADTQYSNHNGVLELEVTVPNGKPELAWPIGASVQGIAQEIADRMWRYPLLQTPIPLLLIVHSPGRVARIARDESGRIRVHGEMLLPDGTTTDSEAQMIEPASQLARVVLSKSLAAWGVAKVATNDETGTIR
jgi:hypothetical protein